VVGRRCPNAAEMRPGHVGERSNAFAPCPRCPIIAGSRILGQRFDCSSARCAASFPGIGGRENGGVLASIYGGGGGGCGGGGAVAGGVGGKPQLEQALYMFKPRLVRLIRSRTTNESRGFAFVDFHSVDDAMAFMHEHGPGGDRLQIDGRNISLEFGVDMQSSGDGGGLGSARMDWMCSSCGAQNFSRRSNCFKCGASRAEGTPIPGTGQASRASVNPFENPTSNIPNSVLAVQNLPFGTSDVVVADTMRVFSQVKEVRVFPDPTRPAGTKAIAFVDFYTPDHATHVLNAAKTVRVENIAVSLSYARPGAMQLMARGGPAMHAMPHTRGDPQDTSRNGGPVVGSTRIKARAKRPEWPPSFEEDGMAWIFDAGSTYFYNQATEFYYEPKSKLYCKRTPDHQYVWYQHVKGQDPPYVAMSANSGAGGAGTAVEGQASTQSTVAVAAAAAGAMATSQDATALAPEATGKASGGGSAGKPVSFGIPKSKAPKTMSINAKKQAKEIAKWGDRQREMGEPDEDATPAAAKRHNATNDAVQETEAVALQPTPVDLQKYTPGASSGGDASSELETLAMDYQSLHKILLDGKPIVKVKKGKWACLLSRRVLTSEEQLQKHIEMSNLYREELVKAIKAGRITRAVTG